jgi:SAM-dependent methyltransferase
MKTVKTVVSLQDLAEQEIHPAALLREFRTLTTDAVAALFAGPLVAVGCPACGAHESAAAFETLSVQYQRCRVCASVFASPRPADEALAVYDREAPPSVFWRDRMLTATRDVRRDKLTRPRAEWVADSQAEHAPGPAVVLDLSPEDGTFRDDLRAALPAGGRVVAGSLRSREWTAEGPFDVVTAFDSFDRVSDVHGLVGALAGVLRPGGLLYVTAPSISGFDLQILEGQAGAVLPPAKLNLLSIDGFGRLFGDGSWRILELSTPGLFDVDNVRQAVLAAPGKDWSPVIRSLVLQGDDARRELQEYLQRHRLASFVRMVVRRV